VQSTGDRYICACMVVMKHNRTAKRGAFPPAQIRDTSIPPSRYFTHQIRELPGFSQHRLKFFSAHARLIETGESAETIDFESDKVRDILFPLEIHREGSRRELERGRTERILPTHMCPVCY